MALKRFIADFETRSACDLRKSGAYKYSLHPSTQPTCFAFKVRGEPTVYFLDFKLINTPWRELPEKLRKKWSELLRFGYQFSAHNAFFERCIYENILVKRLGWPMWIPKQYRCTAAKAAACSLPRNLEGAGEAMALIVQKDKRGYSAMMKTCKPTKQYNEWHKARAEKKAGKKLGARKLKLIEQPEPKMFLDYEDDPETWETLYHYCKIDVKSEEQLDIALPDLIPSEQEIWFLNQALNWRGLRIDIPTVKKIVTIMEIESKKKLQELDTLTMGLVTKPGARKSIFEFLALDGIELPDLRAKTVSDNLEGFALTEDGRRLLELRKALSLTSTRKYQSFLHRAMPDDRVRDILLYHGASTGRDTGSGIQPHNFPRPLIKQREIEYVLKLLQEPSAATDPSIVEWIESFYGNSSMVFSSLLRSMLIPSDGCELFVADFAKIEVAVLWWVFDNVPGLKALRKKINPYKYQAAMNLGCKPEDIPDDGPEYQLGKAQVLGCGFGMGAPKFQKTAWDLYRVKLTDEQSKIAVKNYREANRTVPEGWKAVETAAIAAVESHRVFRAGKCKFFVESGFLWIELPSGRRLAYKNPQIAWRVREYEKTVQVTGRDGKTRTITTIEQTQPMKTLEFWAVNSKTKKWSLERTWGGTLTENIVQAIARDLMMGAAVRLEKQNYLMLLTVHDEGLTERSLFEGNQKEFLKIMCETPAWGAGLPIDAKGWQGVRYRK